MWQCVFRQLTSPRKYVNFPLDAGGAARTTCLMPKLILDEFTSSPVSRQRRWQLRKQAQNACRICGLPGRTPYCAKHEVEMHKLSLSRSVPSGAEDLI